jgi:GT2 family glycosyltransferase
MFTVVSLGHNEPHLTEQFITRLVQYTDIPFKLIFTDNGSTEPLRDIIFAHKPDAVVIVEPENIGCPATRNKSMELVDTDICFWLDNDCMVGPQWYKPLLETLQDESIGITGVQGYVVKNPWELPFPFSPVWDGDVDFFMGWIMGFKTKYYMPINNYHIPVNLDDTELCFGIKKNGMRAVCCGPTFARHLVSQTKRGWTFNDQEKLQELWSNWPDKSLFELWK